MAGKEYLKNFRPDLLTGTIDDMLRTGKLQDKATLIEYLNQALQYLKTEPGPNLEYRRVHAGGWIEWWINFLKKTSEDDNGQVLPFNMIKKSLLPQVDYGTLFGGGSEGHAGHRFAVDWMLNHVHPILLLERDSYIEAKERGGPFLDLRARVSMWARYNSKIIVSVLPEKPKRSSASFHYKRLFDKTGARYCFASKADPYVWEKIGRGELQPFTVIPALYIQHTTDKTEKLFDETEDLTRLRTILNTTDNVQKLLGTDDRSDSLDLY